jgi:RNA-binding protein
MEKLSSAARRLLKQQAHALKPVMQLGKEGATPAFLQELASQLQTHELLKVRVLKSCPVSIAAMEEQLNGMACHLVQKVGHMLTLFRQREEDSNFANLLRKKGKDEAP